MAKRQKADQRKRLIGLIHVAKKQLGLGDEDYRTVLQAATGKGSCAEMTVAELERVLGRFKGYGFEVAVAGTLSPRTEDNDSAVVAKLRALWIVGAEAGVIRNRYEEGLRRWVKRMWGVERVEWLTDEGAQTAVEALKAWLVREGVELE